MLVSAAPYWRELGVSAEVIATGSEPGPYAQDMERGGYRVHHVPVGRSPGDFLRFWRFLRGSGFDLVHQHAEGRGYWLSLTARAAAMPVVRTVHNNFPFAGNLRTRRRLQRRHLRGLGVQFVAVAPGVRDNERQLLGNPCELIWNWLDLPRFARIDPAERREARERLEIAPGTTVIASVGNCSAIKNHAAILGALAALAPRHALLYLHAGVEDAAASEREQARALGLDRNVRFLGWQREVRPVLAAADLFLMPSRFEGLGNAAIEALALGLPALLADTPGLRDLRDHFPSIRYCPPTPEGVVAALESALTAAAAGGVALPSAQLDEQVSTCRALFAPERGAREYAQLYRRVCGSGSR
jgi:glycosyltransferase involved in cell wall biosynthesis